MYRCTPLKVFLFCMCVCVCVCVFIFLKRIRQSWKHQGDDEEMDGEGRNRPKKAPEYPPGTVPAQGIMNGCILCIQVHTMIELLCDERLILLCVCICVCFKRFFSACIFRNLLREEGLVLCAAVFYNVFVPNPVMTGPQRVHLRLKHEALLICLRIRCPFLLVASFNTKMERGLSQITSDWSSWVTRCWGG